MQSLLGRYIAKTIIRHTLLVLFIVIALVFFMNFLGELRDIGEGDYGVAAAAWHALLEVPHHTYQLFAMIVLIGALLGLGTLVAHQELMIVRVAGGSLAKIYRAVLSASLILIACAIILGELISPFAHRYGEEFKSLKQSHGQALATIKGLWVHENNYFYHINAVHPGYHLEGVSRYQFDENRHLIMAVYIDKMNYVNQQWLLTGVHATQFFNNNKAIANRLPQDFSINLNPHLLNIGMIQPDELPIYRLIHYARNLEKNGLQASEFFFNYWKRILLPFTIIVMLCLAIPFVFVQPRSKNAGLRLLLGIIVGFVFYILNALLGQVSIVFQIPPFIAALMPILLFSLVSVWLVKKKVY